MQRPPKRTGPLAQLKVLELGHYIAAPFCTRILGDLGAEVIKVEPPGGDPVRGWGAQVNGNPVWFSVHGRNKLSVVLDLKRDRDVVLKLAARADVLVENLRAGQLERLGLGPEVLHAVNARLVIARISGYGQDGPYRDKPAFGAIGEAMGGLRHLTGHPPGASALPPPRCGLSISDDLAGLYAAIGLLAAVWERDAAKAGTCRGRVVDVNLVDSVFSLMEGMLHCGADQHLSLRRRQVALHRRQFRLDFRAADDGDRPARAGPRPSLCHQCRPLRPARGAG